MNKFLSLSLLGATLAQVSACTPADFETDPVTLTTDIGDVVCQLYSNKTVVLDRAIHMPRAMHVGEADALCHQEGERRMKK
tara:strand:- start:1366 stop:1608 length:243 start_codon:yes stop_codon:yes gene_type:complete